MSIESRVLSCALSFILIAAFVSSTFAAGEVDPTFNPGLINLDYSGGGKNTVRRVVVQPDGKILIAGLFSAVHKYWANNVARLNADGSVDTTFRAPDIRRINFDGVPGSVYALTLQSDGKILIGGNFTHVGGESRPGIARLNSDGSLDASFVSADTFNLAGLVSDIELAADGKIFVGGSFTYNIPPNQRLRFARLFANGSLDPSYYPQSIITVQSQVQEILPLPGDKTLIAVGQTMYRLNSAAVPELSIAANGLINRFTAQSDGKILVGGNFTTFNGFPIPARMVRLNTNDSIDTSFTPPTMTIPGEVRDFEILPSGKILVTGQMATSATKNVLLLNPDGTADNSVSYAGTSLSTFDSAIQGDGKIVVGAEAGDFTGDISQPLVRLSANGSLDPVQLVVGNNGKANDLFVLPDGKIMVGGSFNFINAIFRINTARIFWTGATDPAFRSELFTDSVFGLRTRTDGTVLVSANTSFSKLTQNGSLLFDTGGVSYDAVPLPDGRTLLGLNNFLRLLNSNNTFDLTFNVETNASLKKIIVQPDGKILIAGFFTTVNDTARGRIARVNSDGTLDTSFAPTGGANGVVNDIALQPDGKIVIAGQFSGVNFDTTHKFLARLNPDGGLDATFNPVVQDECTGLRLQPDGKILAGCYAIIGGNPGYSVKRYTSDGSVDPTFDMGLGADGPIRSIELLPGNLILIGGDFRMVNGVDRLGMARLFNNLPAGPEFDYDGDGKSDVSVFRPAENRWYVLRSMDSSIFQPFFGAAGDIPVPADFDGDQKTDVAIYRPSNGQWWYLSSVDGSQVLNPFGASGDIPRPSDFDGDGKADLVIFRPSNSTWYRFSSATNQEVAPLVFGLAGDQPVIGDFDGDGRSDPAIFRPSNGDWWYAASSADGAFRNVHWGQNGDLPVPADYDGDSKTDYAVFRPSDGGWYVYNSGNGTFTTTAFGTNGDRPVAADYDGDGRADLAVFRPSTGIWYLLRSTSGFAGLQFGISTDTPTPGAFVP